MGGLLLEDIGGSSLIITTGFYRDGVRLWLAKLRISIIIPNVVTVVNFMLG